MVSKLEELEKRVHQLNMKIGGEWKPHWQLLWIYEELGELSRELQKHNQLPAKLHDDSIEKIKNQIKEEFGDVLYGLISLSKNLDLNVLESLEFSINKFEKRHSEVGK